MRFAILVPRKSFKIFKSFTKKIWQIVVERITNDVMKYKCKQNSNWQVQVSKPCYCMTKIALNFHSKKYSKSGVMLPIISPVNENFLPEYFVRGKIIAGWQNVKGISSESTSDNRQL